MADETEEALKLDLMFGGTAIVRHNPDGSIERIAPEDFYRPPDEEDDRIAVRRLARRRAERSRAIKEGE